MSQQARPISALCLSGGGFRAAFYHLGVLAFLQNERRLATVQNIVSVSGGSILSVYAAQHWEELVKSDEDFAAVAARFISFAQTNPRNRVVIPWLWSRLILLNWFSPSWGKTQRLRKLYNELYDDATFEALPKNAPNLVVVATDSIRHERVAFTTNLVVRFRFSGEPVPSSFSSQGVRVSLAVATSSCFPPFFLRMRLSHRDLGLSFAEFKDALSLNDGGVATNLGIEMLLLALSDKQRGAGDVIVSDAERPLTDRPSANPLADIAATGSALSDAARNRLEQELKQAKILRFADRLPKGSELSFVAETELHRFRTDLDSPTWEELNALLIKGALQAADKLGCSKPISELLPSILELIQKSLIKAGCKETLQTPTDKKLLRCGKRPMKRVLLHGILVGGLLLGEAYVLYRAGVAEIRYVSYRDENELLVKELKDAKEVHEKFAKRLEECMKIPSGALQTRCIAELDQDVQRGRAAIDRVEKTQQHTDTPLSDEQQQDIARLRDSTDRWLLTNALKQIGLAIANYRDTRGELPGGHDDQSWRMEILPYFAQSSPFPRETTEGLPPIARQMYQYPGDENADETNVVAVTGPGTFWDRKLPTSVIDDGTENLIVAFLVEGTGIAIDDNRDLSVNEAIIAIQAGETPFESGTVALLADGSVRLIGRRIDESTLRNLLVRPIPSLVASKPAAHERFKTSRGVNVQ